MKLYYSAHTGGFYTSDLHQTLPDDAVKISAQTHQALLKANAQGARIEADAQGYPQAVFPTDEQVLVQAKTTALSQLTTLARTQCQQAVGMSDENEITMILYRYRIAQAIQGGTASLDEHMAFAKEIEARGLNESQASFCDAVLKRGARLMQAIGITEGLKHRALEAVQQATSLTGLEALIQDLTTRLNGALAQLKGAV